MSSRKDIDFLTEAMLTKSDVQDALREKLAALEHDQWVDWSKDIAANEKLSPERLERWKKLWKPYSELTQEEKAQDRVYADKVMKVL